MNSLRVNQWVKIAVLLVAGVLILGGTNGVAAATLCKKVNGKLTLQTVTGPGCLSPVGLCATGAFTGDIAGTIAFTGTSITDADATASPNVVETSVIFVTGDNTITTSGGTLSSKDAIVLQTAGAGLFTEVDTIIDGTGEWEDATGTLTASGVFGPDGGEGRYVGEICTP